jgi:deazaflavin-dependent oxidoreductase (nitroreductase family)
MTRPSGGQGLSDRKDVDPTDRAAFNAMIIEEFRTNNGNVTFFGDVPVLLLHHRGAKSGEPRVNPLMFQRVGDSFAVFASKGGEPDHPAWYHNLRANARTTIEVGEHVYDVVARVAEGPERERIWEQQKADNPSFASMEARTTRVIPVVVLDKIQ